MVAQKLTELSAFCMTMLQSERSGQRKMARDKAVGPAISPEDRPPMPKSHKLVGIWISNRSNVIVRIVIYEHAGKVWMEYGGQGGVSELVRKKQGNLTVFRDKNPHPSDIEANLHWIMNADGSLEWHGSGRLQETARPIRK